MQIGMVELTNCRLSLNQVAEGGSVAEEVISSVRTAHAFGTQGILGGIYASKVEQTVRFDVRGAFWHAFGFSLMFFALYGGYALGESCFELRFCCVLTCPSV